MRDPRRAFLAVPLLVMVCVGGFLAIAGLNAAVSASMGPVMSAASIHPEAQTAACGASISADGVAMDERVPGCRPNICKNKPAGADCALCCPTGIGLCLAGRCLCQL